MAVPWKAAALRGRNLRATCKYSAAAHILRGSAPAAAPCSKSCASKIFEIIALGNTLASPTLAFDAVARNAVGEQLAPSTPARNAPFTLLGRQCVQSRDAGQDCRLFGTGQHVVDCQTEQACLDWSAAGPWNPIQAQAANCGWNGPTNDVDSVAPVTDGVKLTKQNPYHFTKTGSRSRKMAVGIHQEPSDDEYAAAIHDARRSSLPLLAFSERSRRRPSQIARHRSLGYLERQRVIAVDRTPRC